MNSIEVKSINLENFDVSTKKLSLPLDLEEYFVSDLNISYVLRWQLAKRRSGNAKVKTMAEISGTTAKPWKQKGTGRARQGSRRSVQFVGGRTCHGPVVRSFGFSIPKKIANLGLFDTIFTKIKNNNVFIFSGDIKNSSTSLFAKMTKSLQLKNGVFVYCSDDDKDFIMKSTRNLVGFKSIDVSHLNSYDIIKYENLIFTDSAIESTILKKYN